MSSHHQLYLCLPILITNRIGSASVSRLPSHFLNLRRLCSSDISVLQLFQSIAKNPHTYRFAAKFWKKRGATPNIYRQETPDFGVSLDRAWRAFLGFFKVKTGIDWSDRVLKMSTMGKEFFQYCPPVSTVEFQLESFLFSNGIKEITLTPLPVFDPFIIRWGPYQPLIHVARLYWESTLATTNNRSFPLCSIVWLFDSISTSTRISKFPALQYLALPSAHSLWATPSHFSQNFADIVSRRSAGTILTLFTS